LLDIKNRREELSQNYYQCSGEIDLINVKSLQKSVTLNAIFILNHNPQACWYHIYEIG